MIKILDVGDFFYDSDLNREYMVLGYTTYNKLLTLEIPLTLLGRVDYVKTVFSNLDSFKQVLMRNIMIPVSSINLKKGKIVFNYLEQYQFLDTYTDKNFILLKLTKLRMMGYIGVAVYDFNTINTQLLALKNPSIFPLIKHPLQRNGLGVGTLDILVRKTLERDSISLSDRGYIVVGMNHANSNAIVASCPMFILHNSLSQEGNILFSSKLTVINDFSEYMLLSGAAIYSVEYRLPSDSFPQYSRFLPSTTLTEDIIIRVINRYNITFVVGGEI